MSGRTSSTTAMTLVSSVLSALYQHHHRVYSRLILMTSRRLGIMQHRHDPSMTANNVLAPPCNNKPADIHPDQLQSSFASELPSITHYHINLLSQLPCIYYSTASRPEMKAATDVCLCPAKFDSTHNNHRTVHHLGARVPLPNFIFLLTIPVWPGLLDASTTYIRLYSESNPPSLVIVSFRRNIKCLGTVKLFRVCVPTFPGNQYSRISRTYGIYVMSLIPTRPFISSRLSAFTCPLSEKISPSRFSRAPWIIVLYRIQCHYCHVIQHSIENLKSTPTIR
jgi:hypothetical protein